jgi:hypothetical protein
MQLSTEHLTQQPALDPDTLLALRAHLAHMSSVANQDLLGLPHLLPPVASSQASTDVSNAAVRGALALKVEQLPAHVASGLRACGLEGFLGRSVPAAADVAAAAAAELTGAAAADALCASSGCPIQLLGPPALQQQQQVQHTIAPNPGSTAQSTSRQPGTLSSAGPAKLECSIPAATEPTAGAKQAGIITSSSSSPFASVSSPKSPHSVGFSRPMSPRGLSRLSPRDGTQQYQYRTSRCASRSYSLCSASAKAVAAAEDEVAAAAAAAAADSAAASEPSIAVESNGRGLLQPGALQWAALHSKAVAAVDASSYVVLSVGLDGALKVRDSLCMHMGSGYWEW